MDSRGQAEMIEWFPRMILLVVAVVVIFVLVNYYSNREIDGGGVERSALLYRLYYDGNLIMYKDPLTGRSYPGIVDIRSFDEKALAAKFPGRTALAQESRVAACLELVSDQGPYQPRTICTDRQTFEHYKPIAESGMGGPQGASIERASFPVAIKDGTTQSSGTLTITVVRRSS